MTETPRPASMVADGTHAANVGLRDAVLAGWYSTETGELFKGFSIRAGDVVADIGCGDGGNAAFCGRFAARVMVADIDAGRVASTVQRVRDAGHAEVEGYVTDGDPLPIASASATRIVCTEVLEHVPDAARFLAELVRIGAPGAEYLLAVPDPLSERLQRPVAYDGYFAEPNHVRIIERDGFAALVESAGLTITRRTGFGFYWTMWMLMFWQSGIEIGGSHPILDAWSRAWSAFLDTEEGCQAKLALDAILPKSQLILARKA